VQENRPNKAASSQRIRARWQLLYTLVNNPSLLGSRKHFQTMQTSESVRNGTPNRTSKQGSRKESGKVEAEPVQSPESASSQDKTE
ncbi:Receptor for retinol uptake stra6, partial [Xenoophorus captivus]